MDGAPRASISRPRLFDEVVSKLLFRIGLALLAGALFTVIGQPLAYAIFDGNLRRQSSSPREFAGAAQPVTSRP